MEENAKGEEQLNSSIKRKEELEEAKQRLYDLQKDIDGLDIPEGFYITNITEYSEVKLSDAITEKDVIAIEVETEEREKQTQLYKRLEENKFMLIATINEEEKIFLSEEYKEKYRGIIPETQLNEPYQLDRQTLEQHKSKKSTLNNKDKALEHDTNSKTGKEHTIAMALGVSEDQILNIIEVKDESTMSNVVNRDIDNQNIFLVRLRQNDAGMGSNDYVMMNLRKDGTFEVASKTELSNTFEEISKGLGIKDSTQYEEIQGRELQAVANPYGNTRHVEVNQYSFKDGNRYILAIDTNYEAQMHVYKEENGKYIPVCEKEHGRHEEKEIELPDGTKEIEDEERTPWGDAEARRNRY